MEIEVTRGAHRLRLARLSEAPFTDRLVHKFGLRVEGWRGGGRPRWCKMLAELRIADLGVISEATLELHPGLTVVTGETGAGKTMVVTGLGLLLGGRADPKAVRRGAERARVEGRFAVADRPDLLVPAVAAGGRARGRRASRLPARHGGRAGRGPTWAAPRCPPRSAPA